ncbi:cell envelope biogenesis protein OmpA [Streptomyces mobaraensis]|uniref:cell envelope biogenesis protein OmpA n=1 Tax=Streptomyces mobaraensis TaxID=35621 RepID=UPI001878F63D|nr:cell envelope biogenesis protein OmpA [Streptomyces mobaraensis]
MDVKVGAAPEPGLDPECLAYTAKACPMLNGSASEYRGSPVGVAHPVDRPCSDPGCSCPRIVPDAQHEVRSGRPADDWDAWMIRSAHYRLKLDQDQPGALLGIDLSVPVLRARPLRRAPRLRLEPTQIEQLRAALRALSL